MTSILKHLSTFSCYGSFFTNPKKRCFRDFQINLPTILENCLVPVLPLRLNFLHLVSDFISRITKESFELVDVGCGPYAILSILALKLFGWKSRGYELVENSRNNAQKIVLFNELSNDIKILSSGCLGSSHTNGQIGEKRKIEESYVIICNPPWFTGDNANNHEKAKIIFFK